MNKTIISSSSGSLLGVLEYVICQMTLTVAYNLIIESYTMDVCIPILNAQIQCTVYLYNSIKKKR